VSTICAAAHSSTSAAAAVSSRSRRCGSAPNLVHSFDYDAESVEATEALRAKHLPDASWMVERGDATDTAYCESLGASTSSTPGASSITPVPLWKAMRNVIERFAEGGRFFVAIGNDRGERAAAGGRSRSSTSGSPSRSGPHMRSP
jgi:hypothetical protein